MNQPTYTITIPDSCLVALAENIKEKIENLEWWRNQKYGLTAFDEELLEDYYWLYDQITNILKKR